MVTYQNEDDSIFYNAESRPFYQTSFTSRFMSVLRPFNVQKLHELNNLIYEAISSVGNKEIFECYQILIEDIFSTEKGTNWNLFVKPNSQYNEFNLLYSFLNSDGDLFNLIKFLMGDPSFKFFFPVSKLSVPSRMLIEQGITPNFFLNKIDSDSMTIYPSKIQLNAFEFFFFHFAHYIKDMNTILETGNNEKLDYLYLNLLDCYLIKFLPTNNNIKCLQELNTSNTQNSIWQSLSSTTSNLLHLGQQTNSTAKSSKHQDSSLIHRPSLLNIKPLQNYSFKKIEENVYNQKSFDSVGSVVYKCETIINILTEMWLNIKIPTNLIKKKTTNSTSLITNNCPNVIYMMCVRYFIKQAHYFANSQTDKSLEMGNMPAFENNELDEIKKSVWTSSKYQIPKRFYSFIKFSFEHWPCDSSFRAPLETWLSFIQPWRYLNECQLLGSTNINNSTSNQHQLTNLNKWKNFIQENILFYTTIYKDILSRFINLDLLSLKNSNMLFRIAKVFCQLNLSDLIREAESNCDTAVSNSWLASASLRGSLLSPNLRNNSQSVCNKDLSFTTLLEDDEKTSFVYVSFFSEDIKKIVVKLISKIKVSIEKIEKFEKSTREKSIRERNQIKELFVSFFNTSNLPFDLEEKQNLEEMLKIRSLLETVCARFIQLYEIDLNEITYEDALYSIDTAGDRLNSLDNQTISNKEPSLNPFTLDNIEYNGNPDLQPVRTYEFYYLVFFFIYLSELINGYYSDAFIKFYESNGLIGWFARLILAAPHEFTIIEKNGIQTQRRISKKLPPRLNLRFLASKQFYVYLFLLFVFIQFYLFNKTLLAFLLITSILVVLFVKLVMLLNISI